MKELCLQGWGQMGKTVRLMCEPPPGELGSVELGHTGEAQDWCQKGCGKRKRAVLRDVGNPGRWCAHQAGAGAGEFKLS